MVELKSESQDFSFTELIREFAGYFVLLGIGRDLKSQNNLPEKLMEIMEDIFGQIYIANGGVKSLRPPLQRTFRLMHQNARKELLKSPITKESLCGSPTDTLLPKSKAHISHSDETRHNICFKFLCCLSFKSGITLSKMEIAKEPEKQFQYSILGVNDLSNNYDDTIERFIKFTTNFQAFFLYLACLRMLSANQNLNKALNKSLIALFGEFYFEQGGSRKLQPKLEELFGRLLKITQVSLPSSRPALPSFYYFVTYLQLSKGDCLEFP